MICALLLLPGVDIVPDRIPGPGPGMPGVVRPDVRIATNKPFVLDQWRDLGAKSADRCGGNRE